MDTDNNKKNEIKGKPSDSPQDATAEMREAIRSALAAWRSANTSPRPRTHPARAAAGRPQGNTPGPFDQRFGPQPGQGAMPIPVRPRAAAPAHPTQFSGTPVSGRPFFIRALTWIAFLTIVVLLFRLIR